MPPRKRAPAAKKAPARRRTTKADRDAAAAAEAAQAAATRLTTALRVLELRRSGFSFDRLLAQPDMLGDGAPPTLTREEVYDLYELGVAQTIPQPADQVRRLELDRLERLIPPLYSKALTGDAAAAREVRGISKLRVEISRQRGPLDVGRPIGSVETATIAELADLKVRDATLSASALILARCVDDAGTESSAANAARELRMTMATLRGLYLTDGGQGKPLAEEPPAADGTVVTPPSRLAELRKRSADRATPAPRGKRGR